MVKKNKLDKRFLFWVGVVVLVLAVYFAWPSDEVVGDYDSFAKCLSESGVVMYGTSWCSHCNAQKKLFGASFEFVEFVDCDEDKDSCVAVGVPGYPTWRIKGENYPGEKSLEDLSALSGCSIFSS